MAFHLYEDTWETSTTTGTGAYTLAGEVSGARAFSEQYANADTCWYQAYDGADFEVGLGTYSSGGNTLARTAVYRSTNGGSAVNWAAGTRQIQVAPLGVVMETLFTPGQTGIPRRTADNVFSYMQPTEVKIGSLVATNDATLDVALSSTYSVIKIIFRNLIPQNDAEFIGMRVSQSGVFQSGTTHTISQDNANSSTSEDAIYLAYAIQVENTAANGGLSGVIYVMDPANTTTWKHVFGVALEAITTSNQMRSYSIGGVFRNTGAIDGLRFFCFSGGDIVSGVIDIYGVI